MKKYDLIRKVGEYVGSKSLSLKIVEGLFDAFVSALCRNEEIRIAGFGKFEAVVRKARTGRNPQTGEQIMIPERRAVRFVPGSVLKKSLNNM
jgi:DNA-binding protein HU-beta